MSKPPITAFHLGTKATACLLGVEMSLGRNVSERLIPCHFDNFILLQVCQNNSRMAGNRLRVVTTLSLCNTLEFDFSYTDELRQRVICALLAERISENCGFCFWRTQSLVDLT